MAEADYLQPSLVQAAVSCPSQGLPRQLAASCPRTRLLVYSTQSLASQPWGLVKVTSETMSPLRGSVKAPWLRTWHRLRWPASHPRSHCLMAREGSASPTERLPGCSAPRIPLSNNALCHVTTTGVIDRGTSFLADRSPLGASSGALS